MNNITCPICESNSILPFHLNKIDWFSCNLCKKFRIDCINDEIIYWAATTDYNGKHYSVASNSDTQCIDGVKKFISIFDFDKKVFIIKLMDIWYPVTVESIKDDSYKIAKKYLDLIVFT